ncbi:MAG TPA: SPOR domain-containing protein [Thermoanaerobaculia bacterium]|nr:SPOR domain-containing protein [Thermoanaerobaculia bacterium]
MTEHATPTTSHDDQSHYEISLTAGQAFVAFVLLLLSLAASFAFGLMIGKGQADERLVVRKEPNVITEGSLLPKKDGGGRIVELGVPEDDFKATDSVAPATPETTATEAPVVTEEQQPAPVTVGTVAPPAPAPVATPAPAPETPVYAQLLSTADQKTAEALAVRLINGGYTSAYVVRGTTDKGAIFRVRVKFATEPDARAAEGKLKAYSNEVWITR